MINHKIITSIYEIFCLGIINIQANNHKYENLESGFL